MPCATSYDPGWLPRRPVRAGGYAASGTAPACGVAALAAAARAAGTSEAPTATLTPLMKSRRVIGRSIPSSRSAFLIASPPADAVRLYPALVFRFDTLGTTSVMYHFASPEGPPSLSA